MFSNPDFAFPGRKNMNASNSQPMLPQQQQPTQDARSKRRSSHSRQISVSSQVSSPSSPAKATFSRPVSGSHHRRQSSVSSRRESREVMGMSPSTDGSEESFGSGDSRQRALWALEGKSTPASSATAFLGFTKVEIPDWKTPDVEKDDFSWSSTSSGSSAKLGLTPTVSPSTTPFTYSLTSTLANKRDSFGKNLVGGAASIKAELHTLLEEDENEEEEEDVDEQVGEEVKPQLVARGLVTPSRQEMLVQEPEPILSDPAVDVNEKVVPDVHDNALLSTPVPSSSQAVAAPRTPTVIPPTPGNASRQRPPSLSLRPLSLVASMPMPDPNPTAAKNTQTPAARFKSLTLATNLSTTQTTPPRNDNQTRRNSLLMNGVLGPLTPSPSPNSAMTVHNGMRSASLSSVNERKARRRSSIGYRKAAEETGLPTPSTASTSSRSFRRQSLPPTPGLTPNSAVTHRSTSPSTPSDSISSSRASSEFFHSQAVASLLSRISSLEDALAASTAATSPASDARMSFPPVTNPIDLGEKLEASAKYARSHHELIAAIADLKAERDELTNDISGWRTRCSDLTNSMEMLQRRVVDERRELLLVHQRLSSVTSDLNSARTEKMRAEEELSTERTALEREKRERHAMENELNDERRDRITLEMKSEKDRLKWRKEKEALETERRVWLEERAELEANVAKLEGTIAQLRKELSEKSMRPSSTGRTPEEDTPKPRKPFDGASRPFSFPALPSPATPSRLPEDQPTNAAVGLGFNSTFKFGGVPNPVTPPSSAPKAATHSTQRTSEPPALDIVQEEEEEDPLAGYEDGDEAFSGSGSDQEDPFDAIPAPALVNTQMAPAVASTPRHEHRRSASVVASWRFPSPKTMELKRAQASAKKDKVDRFFACLEEDDNAPTAMLGKPMKQKEHKKLPSGCPAFWLDYDEEPTVIRREMPLPSPAITEEEETTDEGYESAQSSTFSASFTVVPKPVVTPATPASSPPTAPVTLVTAPTVSAPKPISATTRVSLVRASPQSTPSTTPTLRHAPPPSFIPAPSTPTALLPAQAPVSLPLTTVPPPAKSAMTVPQPLYTPSGFGSSASPLSPTSRTPVVASPAPQAPSLASRLQTVSSMFGWSSRPTRPEPVEQVTPLVAPTYTKPGQQVLASYANAPLAASTASSAKTVKAKHVDPEVMRERLRMQLEREGRLSPTKMRRSSSIKRDSNATTESAPCGKCTTVLEL